MIKVLIVDDHTSVREAFKAMFEEKDDFCVVGESANANDCVLLCERLNPDIVLLDVCTEGYSSGLCYFLINPRQQTAQLQDS